MTGPNIDPTFAVLFLAVTFGYALLLNIATLVIEDVGARRYERMQDRLLMLGWAGAVVLSAVLLTLVRASGAVPPPAAYSWAAFPLGMHAACLALALLAPAWAADRPPQPSERC